MTVDDKRIASNKNKVNFANFTEKSQKVTPASQIGHVCLTKWPTLCSVTCVQCNVCAV